MSLLLHACCGPCSMYPVDTLLESGRELDLFWFNPNIHPEFEWNRRLENLKKAADHFNVELITREGFMQDYWLNKEYLSEYESRCRMCYDIRLDAVAKYAKENRNDAFSTTLLVSPYQDHETIIKTADRKAEKYGIDFEYHDFREGFRKGQNMARDIGLYRQKYCGCIFSLEESEFREKIIKSFTS